MKRLAAFASAWAALAACAQAPGAPSPPASNALAGFGWFAELGGACWQGEHPGGKTSDTQCYLAQFERLMRGSIRVMRDGGTVAEGDAVFAVDPAGTGKVVYAQWGTGGTYATGELTFEGDTLVFRNRLADGRQAPVRSIWRRTGPDGFRVVRERAGPEGWKEFLAVEYRRMR
jgi:hypothetical protein